MNWKEYWQNLSSYQKLGIVLTCLVGFILLIFGMSQNQTVQSEVVHEIEDLQELELPDTVFVSVSGQVLNPGVYEVEDSSLVINLLQIAGGLTSDADLVYVHKDLQLAQGISPGQNIYIPSRSEQATLESNLTQKISLNSASKDQLMELPGIGESTADKIIANRPYSSIEGLKDVSGIGDATYNKLVSLISL